MELPYTAVNEPPELWGGIECTINRIGNNYRDQIRYSWHESRENDIQEFGKLGIQKLRYPILWESHQVLSPDEDIDWTTTEKRLKQIAEQQIEPIIGLVHHGSGPVLTSLMDKKFPELLAAYAKKVAQRFPELKYYTPINEPLTTARFSGLYGFWYPHLKGDRDFCRIFVNEMKGIVLSMRAIREVNPEVVLVQTEDLAKVQSSSALQYQADFENQRRWLTYDFLCGKFVPENRLWNYFINNGIAENELQFFMDNPCLPGIAGFNYYVTSERYLDENYHDWPVHLRGNNGRDIYADVATVRVKKPYGLSELLKEAWTRYQLPMAISEVHLNCSREEQLRWFKEAWDTAVTLNREGIPVLAVTAWSLLGSFDWDTLLTQENNIYESGVFKLYNNRIKPTALADLIKNLANPVSDLHPLVGQKGWWHYSYPSAPEKRSDKKERPVLILGGNGTLGTAFKHICNRRNIPFISLVRPQFDITKDEDIEKSIAVHKPWAIINTTGFVKVDEAEIHRDFCYSLNVTCVESLAEICNRTGILLVTFSSDLVFGGKKSSAYTENDLVQPLNYYGYTKAAAEQIVTDQFKDALVIRTSSFFGPWDRYNFAHQLIKSLELQQPFAVVNDITVSPTYIPHLADAVLDLLIDKEKGIWHISNDGQLSWSDFGFHLADYSRLNNKNLVKCRQRDMNWKALRPEFSALVSEKGIKLPSLDKAIECFFKEKVI